MQHALGTKKALSLAYHPQTDGQTERLNHILEDMLRACVLNFKGSWDDHLPLVEFSYNNGYQDSLRMSLFEALYGRICNTPISQSDRVNIVLIGPDMLAEMEHEIQVIKKNLKEK